jgi:L-lysine exporter family protein LysE/ArgO
MFIILGLAIGFMAAIPLGPVNVVVISQTLKRDFTHGFLAGMTASVLDFSCCLVAMVGFFKIRITLSPNALSVMKFLAGLVLLTISARLLKSARTFTVIRNGEKVPPAAARPIVSVLFLYVSNPTIYAFWIAVVGAVTAHNLVHNNGWKPVVFAAACGLGSVLWYLTLTRFLSRRQSRIRAESIRKVFLAMALVLVGFAVFSIGSIFF